MWNPFRRSEQELDKEIRFHLARQVQDLMAEGLAEDEARRRAAIEFGGAEQIKEACREVRGVRKLGNLLRYFRYSIRVLQRSKGFTAVAVLSLALGIGANTAVFQLIDAVLLRPLPVAEADELVEIHIYGGRQGFGNRRLNGELTYPLWEQIRQSHEPFSGVFAWAPARWSVGEGTDVQTVPGAWFSGEAFDVLGIAPERGRLFSAEDDVPGCAPNVVISHRYWQQHFGGAEDAVGAKLRVMGGLSTVIGVAPQEFFGIEVGDRFDLAFPLCVLGNINPDRLAARHEFWLQAFGRLSPGWSVGKAASFLKSSSVGWFEAVAPSNFPAALMKLWNSFRMTATARPNGTSRLRNDYTSSLWLLLGVTTLVLAMACANLANLTLARTLTRGQEVATRLAIGASRYQVIAQLFTESMILAVAGAITGAFLAGTLSKALVRFLNAQGITAELEVGLNWTVFVALSVTALIGCLFFGLTTALYATREKSIACLILGSRGTTGSSHRISFQGLLLAGQVGVSLVLVVSALLFLQSLQNLVTMDAGFVQEGIVYTYVNLPPNPTQPAGVSRLDTETLEAVRRIPGIQAATTSTHLPLNGGRTTLGVLDPVTGRESFPYFTWISPGYFDTMEIPIVAGRDFTTRDSADAPKVMLVNEKFARSYFGDEYPVGRTVRSLEEPGFPETVYQIVGLVANTRYADLRDGIAPIAYLPYAQEPSDQIRAAIVTRSGLPAAAVGKAVEDAISNLHPGARVSATVDLREEVLQGLSRERLLAWLGGFFGFLALTLVAVGLYGVLSYLVSKRRREIGIRMTLGANRRTVVTMILAETTGMMVLGCAIGVGLALAILRLARGLLFGIGPTDPDVIGAGVGILLAVALAASYLPVRAAARTNPVETLRDG